MKHLFVWLWLVAGIIAFRLFSGTTTPLMEHVSGAYFSGAALLAHWGWDKFQKAMTP